MAVITMKSKDDLATLYERADPTSAVAARLQAGVVAQVKHCGSDWCHVVGNGFDGWINSGSGEFTPTRRWIDDPLSEERPLGRASRDERPHVRDARRRAPHHQKFVLQSMAKLKKKLSASCAGARPYRSARSRSPRGDRASFLPPRAGRGISTSSWSPSRKKW